MRGFSPVEVMPAVRVDQGRWPRWRRVPGASGSCALPSGRATVTESPERLDRPVADAFGGADRPWQRHLPARWRGHRRRPARSWRSSVGGAVPRAVVLLLVRPADRVCWRRAARARCGRGGAPGGSALRGGAPGCGPGNRHRAGPGWVLRLCDRPQQQDLRSFGTWQAGDDRAKPATRSALQSGVGAVSVVDHEDPGRVDALVAGIDGEHGRLDVLVNDIASADDRRTDGAGQGQMPRRLTGAHGRRARRGADQPCEVPRRGG